MPRQMTDHTLDGVKGWPSPHAVDFQAPFKAADLSTLAGTGHPAYAGRVVQLDDNGNFIYGVGNYAMPLFLFNNSDDPDVANDGGSSAGNWVGVTPSGKLLAFVAIGGYELESTEFIDTTYVPNDWLTAPTGTTNATSGVLTKETNRANPICGLVSRAKYVNSHGKSVIAFWPVFLPKRS